MIDKKEITGTFVKQGRIYVRTDKGIYSVISSSHLEIRWRVDAKFARMMNNDVIELEAIEYFENH